MIDISLKLERNNAVWNWLKSQENKLISSGHIGTHIDVYNKIEVQAQEEQYHESSYRRQSV